MQASKQEQWQVIRFLAEEGVGGREMYRRMKAVYGKYNLCCSSVMEWCKRFLEGRELLQDDAWHGQVHHVISPQMIAEVNALVLDNPQNHRVRDASVTGY